MSTSSHHLEESTSAPPLNTGNKTQSPSPQQGNSRRVSTNFASPQLHEFEPMLSPTTPAGLAHSATGTRPVPLEAAVRGAATLDHLTVPSGATDRSSLGSPGTSIAGRSHDSHNGMASSHPGTTGLHSPATGPSGRRTPTSFTNSVAASVVRNALPLEGVAATADGNPDLRAGLSQRLASSIMLTDPSRYLSSGDSAFATGDGTSHPVASGTPNRGSTPSGGYALPLGAMTGSGGGSGHAVGNDSIPVSPDSKTYSRERAQENFAKARDLVLSHIKAQHEKMKKALSPGDASAPLTSSQDGAATADEEMAGRHPSANAVDSDSRETDGEGDGGRLFNVIRAAMREADTIDNAEDSVSSDTVDIRSGDGQGNADNASVVNTSDNANKSREWNENYNHNAVKKTNQISDWRDDDILVQSPSAFFRSPASLETTSNRVMEAIIEKGHAAATDEELRWLYRHANVLNLLDKPDLDRVVSASLRREYTNGEPIANQHARMRHLYVVLWGDVEVFRATSLDEEQRALESAFRVTAATQSEAYQGNGTNSSGVSAQGGNVNTQVSTSPHDLLEIQTSRRGRSRSGAASLYEASDDEDGDTIYTHVATLLPGQVFGTESFVFNQDNHFVFRAGGSTKKTVLSLIPFAELQPALATNPRFAQGLGCTIAGSVDVFGPIRQFCRYVFSSQTSQNEYLPLWSIVSAYTQINNVIHTKLFSKELDTGAWGYALNRLPENVTSTFCFDLVHALPPFVASRMRVEAYAADVSKAPGPSNDAARARTAVAYIRTKERRRCTWHLGMEGKDLVLLRDGFTDLLDFLTMLCVHIIESNKLRGRVQGMVHPPAIDILDAYLRDRDQELAECKVVPVEEEMLRIRSILARMPLTPDEQSGLLRNWGQETLLKIYEVMMHREEFNIRVDPSISRKFQINPFHEWALNLRRCVMEKLGLAPTAALPNDLFIDVVSSNTHCIKNLLCSFNRTHRKEIAEYATTKESKKLGKLEEWHTPDDMIYVATSGFLRDERPELKEEFQKSLEENGITVLHDTAMTGLQVDVIPVHLLNLDTIDETIRASLQAYFEQALESQGEGESGPSFRGAPTWSQMCKPMAAPSSLEQHRQQQARNSRKEKTEAAARLSSSSPSTEGTSPSSPNAPSGCRLRRHFIINMDFAFGAQAEGICRAIFSAFGKRIRSVSVMGKAGGMQGKRGDIQLASHVLLSKSSLILEDNQDELRSCRNQDLTKERLQELAGPRVEVHHGKVLTVTGTMLQNVPLLRYYKNVWRCVGTEMEGSYFARVIEDFYRQGIAHPNLHTRFAYYTSDLPLAQSEAEEEAKRGKRHAGATATLSAPMTPQEGVPPLYAIARGILENVLLS